jgi:tRNA A37 threonylcarbamoyladenosine biosynthesis protein TsaE
MPYKSLAQEKYFNANRKELESKGVDVAEWNKESKGRKLPKKVKIKLKKKK